MKKVLFATTALIATASMAAADVRLSGYGRFGLDYNDGNGRGVNGIPETTLTSRLRLQIDMSTETDGGVAFGARFRAEAESRDNVPGGAVFNGGRFYVTSGGFTLQVGNIIGAFENAPGLYLETRTADIGIDGAGFHSVVANVNGTPFNWDAYSSTGAGVNGVEVLYTIGSFGAHVSMSTRNGPTAVDRIAAHAFYTFGDWTASVAVQDSDIPNQDKTFAALSGNIGQFGVRVAYADNDGIDKVGLYGNMDIGAASNILAYVTDEDNPNPAFDGTGYGIHYSYDLGGGVSFEAGARRTSGNAASENTTVQAGVYFSF